MLVDCDKYEYRLEKTVKLKKSKVQKTYWACRYAEKAKCKARLVTMGEENELKIVSKGNVVHNCQLPW